MVSHTDNQPCSRVSSTPQRHCAPENLTDCWLPQKNVAKTWWFPEDFPFRPAQWEGTSTSVRVCSGRSGCYAPILLAMAPFRPICPALRCCFAGKCQHRCWQCRSLLIFGHLPRKLIIKSCFPCFPFQTYRDTLDISPRLLASGFDGERDTK